MKYYKVSTFVVAVFLCACGVGSSGGQGSTSSNSQQINRKVDEMAQRVDAINGLRLNKAVASQAANFSLEIENVSKGVLRLWRESNSWGAACWRVLLIRDRHLEVFYQNPDQGFTRNAPVFYEVAAGERVNLALNLNGGNWCGLGHCSKYNERGFGGRLLTLEPDDSLIVIYDVPATQEAFDNGVWYGVIAASAEVK